MKRWQLWLNPRYRWLVYKNGRLWANQDYYWCFWLSGGYSRCGSTVPWLTQINCKQSGLGFDLKILPSLNYFLRIKQRLSTTFYPHTNGQIKRQNSIIEIYLRVFINYEQNNWARHLPIVEFAYNNAKNISTGHTSFELNCDYHPYISYKKNIDPCFKSKSVDKLSTNLKELMTVYRETLYHIQKLQKQAYNKAVKPRSYVSGNKVWLNSKYIRTKQNCKLNAKFFKPFQILHLVGNQAYKLELPKKWKIHGIFHMFLLEHDIKKKG